MWEDHEEILAHMDLQGAYQRKNLRTVLTALDVFANICHGFAGESSTLSKENCGRCLRDAIIATAGRTGFRGRWEKLSDKPLTICDIGHNEHGLRHNFAQLEAMKADGRCTDLIIVYGSVADKDVDAVLHLMPEDATYVFTQANSKRALPAAMIKEKYLASGKSAKDIYVRENVSDAVSLARSLASGIQEDSSEAMPLIYIGGSTYVVSEAVTL
jgi:dihydrofolate synthase/folylpolyglutamate synthase